MCLDRLLYKISGSIEVSIRACQADANARDRGSIPRLRVSFFLAAVNIFSCSNFLTRFDGCTCLI